MRLSNIREVSRVANKVSGKIVNMKKGVSSSGYDVYFYTYKGARVIIPTSEVSSDWIRFAPFPDQVISVGSVVRLSKRVKNHHCPVDRDDYVVAKVLNIYGNSNDEVSLMSDLHGCKYWNLADLILVK